MGINGFGRTTVYGRSRVPIPPARITARSHIVEMALIPSEVFGTLKPVYGRCQTLTERCRRFESCRFPKFSIVAPQAADLALPRPQPLCICHRDCLRSHQLGNEMEQVAHANLAICADLKYLAIPPFHAGDRQESLTRVLDECEIPGWLQGAYMDLRCPRSHLRNTGGNDGSRGLPRTIGIERACDHYWKVERIVEA